MFCSFLALVLRKELERRLNNAGHVFEWSDITQDLKALQLVTIEEGSKRFVIRSRRQGKLWQDLSGGKGCTSADDL